VTRNYAARSACVVVSRRGLIFPVTVVSQPLVLWMTAARNDSAGTEAVVRNPPKNETRGLIALGSCRRVFQVGSLSGSTSRLRGFAGGRYR
jgi:hypothetical protein